MVFCFFTLGVTSERSHFVAEFQAKNDKKGQTRIHAPEKGNKDGSPTCHTNASSRVQRVGRVKSLRQNMARVVMSYVRCK